MSKAEKIFDTVFTARNFNTSPLTISGLNGDLYDYEILEISEGGPDDNSMVFKINADGGTNYRNYLIQGFSATVQASTGDAAVRMIPNPNHSGSTFNAFSRYTIEGESGDERKVTITGSGVDSVGARVYSQIKTNYWKNTADEITSFTFDNTVSGTYDSHIIIYRTKKASTRENWELVKTIDFTARDLSSGNSPIVFSGLDGDTDLQYRIDWFGDNGTGNSTLELQINSDALLLYNDREIQNTSGSPTEQTRTAQGGCFIQQDGDQRAVMIINAETGKQRTVLMSASKINATFQQIESSWFYSDTAANITGLRLIANGGTNQLYTGSVKLYRKKNPSVTSDTLPFEVVNIQAVNSDLVTGHTFSGLTGDSNILYKLEFFLDPAAPNAFIDIILNGDSTAANYSIEILKADSGGLTAATSAAEGRILRVQTDDESNLTMYLYSRTGGLRPAIGINTFGIGGSIAFLSGWWTNTASEITSIGITSSSVVTNHVGTIKLSRLV